MPELAHAAEADGYKQAIPHINGIARLEDTASDVFTAVQDMCMRLQLAHDLSYHSAGEAAPRQWLCYRPGEPSGFSTYPVGESLPNDIKPLAEC